jgi:hypothetical protein
MWRHVCSTLLLTALAPGAASARQAAELTTRNDSARVNVGGAPADSAAQVHARPRSVTQGLKLQLRGFGGSLTPDFDGDREDEGGGVGLTVGWGFSRNWLAFLSWDGMLVDVLTDPGEFDYGLETENAGVRYTGGEPARRWLWYVEGGVSWNRLWMDSLNAETRGWMHQQHEGIGRFVGGGVQYHLGPAWALDIGLRWDAATFGEFEVDSRPVDREPYDMNGYRATFSIAWYPMMRYREGTGRDDGS